jgi:hypothetical protein
MMKYLLLFPVFTLVQVFMINAQPWEFSGRVVDGQSLEPLPNAEVTVGFESVFADENGDFLIKAPANTGELVLVIFKTGYVPREIVIDRTQGFIQDLGSIRLDPEGDLIPTIFLNEQELEASDNESQDISGILSASRDVFVNTAAFTLGQARFRMRGYDSENTSLIMNGIEMNDPENGRTFWSVWGGLNDVTRNRDVKYGLTYADFDFGGIGGATYMDLSPSLQRKQLRVTYSRSNRTFENRLMATWSTGWLPKGWAVSLSASRRWGDEGYVEGTYYDAYSWYAGVEKRIAGNHRISLIGFAAPVIRGRVSAAVQEAYDLAGSNFYNPNWGFQDGKKRNSREFRSNRIVAFLTHEWDISPDINLTTSFNYQDGRVGSTALDWNNARDPRPDFYRYLPSYQQDPNLEEQVAEKWRNDVNTRQLDWGYMYDVNRNSFFVVENANGIEGNTIEGLRSKYILEDRRNDPNILAFSSTYNQVINDKIDLSAGVRFRKSRIDYFKVVDDLMGGEYALDVDRFAERDFASSDDDLVQIDLQNPNRVVYEGDKFGYNYELHNTEATVFAQTLVHLRKIDFHLGANLDYTEFYREGNYQTGLFPDNSLGKSEKQEFLTYGLKGGATYKVTGRHFLYANGFLSTRAPFMRNSFTRPRVTNDINPFLTEEKIRGFEAGYRIQSPTVKARATVYHTVFEDQNRILAFYNDIERTFGYFIMSDLDFRHQGVELAAEFKVSPTISLTAVGAFGEYVHTSRPKASTIDDRSNDFIFEEETIYADNFKVSGTPMTAASFGINYSSPKFWFVNLNFSFFDDIFIDFNPNRRRIEAVEQVEYDSEQWRKIVDQESPDGGISLDLFGGKSWKVKDYFIYLNVGINNILNDTNLITGGYEQLRFDGRDRDPEAFPPEYFYRFGLNYFINLSLRL